jgi:hypothetical protein
MFFLISGEGKTDMGQCAFGQSRCSGSEFQPGPMGLILDRLLEGMIDYSPLETQAMEFVPEHEVTQISQQLPRYFSGKKHGMETGVFFKNARALARLAKQKSTADADAPVAAVLFRDADGTHSQKHGDFESKWKAMMDGFAAEGFHRGVPMIPCPKSEAWLLCALRDDKSHDCASLESNLPGNDKSPNSAKTQLAATLAKLGKTTSDLQAMIMDGALDPGVIDMPSFNRFKERLEVVVQEMLSA